MRVRDPGDGCLLDNRSHPHHCHSSHPCIRLPPIGDSVHMGAMPRVLEGQESQCLELYSLPSQNAGTVFKHFQLYKLSLSGSNFWTPICL